MNYMNKYMKSNSETKHNTYEPVTPGNQKV